MTEVCVWQMIDINTGIYSVCRVEPTLRQGTEITSAPEEPEGSGFIPDRNSLEIIHCRPSTKMSTQLIVVKRLFNMVNRLAEAITPSLMLSIWVII